MAARVPPWMILTPVAVGLLITGILVLLPGPSSSHTNQPAHPDDASRESQATTRLIVRELQDHFSSGGSPADAKGKIVVDKLNLLPDPDLHHLESVVLDRNRTPLLRVELLKKIASAADEAADSFILQRMMDRAEDDRLRILAVKLAGQQQTARAFEALLVLWNDGGFKARPRVLLALGATGDERAPPILRTSLNPAQPIDMRTHAAQGLGHFVGDPKVRRLLRDTIRMDRKQPVRRSALNALCRFPGIEVDDLLRSLREDPELGNDVAIWIEKRK